jgi:hypothetical protein
MVGTAGKGRYLVGYRELRFRFILKELELGNQPDFAWDAQSLPHHVKNSLKLGI